MPHMSQRNLINFKMKTKDEYGKTLQKLYQQINKETSTLWCQHEGIAVPRLRSTAPEAQKENKEWESKTNA